jgi:hypothetical protein
MDMPAAVKTASMVATFMVECEGVYQLVGRERVEAVCDALGVATLHQLSPADFGTQKIALSVSKHHPNIARLTVRTRYASHQR